MAASPSEKRFCSRLASAGRGAWSRPPSASVPYHACCETLERRREREGSGVAISKSREVACSLRGSRPEHARERRPEHKRSMANTWMGMLKGGGIGLKTCLQRKMRW